MSLPSLSCVRAAWKLLLIGGAIVLSVVLIPQVAAQAFLLEAGKFEGQKITEVEIRYRGGKTVDEARIRNFMAVRPGRIYKQSSLDEDIKTLYGSGLVDDVQFFADDAPGGVKVIAEVVTRPLINGLGFSGNTHFRDRTLANQTKLSIGQVLSDSQIIRARRNIEKYYQDYGYPDVTVTHRLQATSREGYADLVFVIEEGAKSEIRRILFEGNQVFSDGQLRKQMNTKQKNWLSFLNKSGRIDSAAIDEDIKAVRDYYQARGYWRAQVGVPRRVAASEGRVDLVIPVQEGPKYTVNSVGFGNIRVFRPEELRPALSLIEGMGYSSKKVRDDIRMIRSYYGSRGYADAAVVPDVRENQNNTVDITYRITPGKVFKVGRVNIQGNTKSQDRVIRRELPMRPGEPFNSVDLETAKRRLQNMNYFNDVQVNSGGGRSNFRDVNVLVNEKKTGSFNFGLGLSSIDNIVGFISLDQSNYDIRQPFNFAGGGGGQRLSLNLRAGTERQDFSLSLTEPWFMGKRLSLGGEIFARDSQFFSDIYEQSNTGAAISIRKPLGRRSFLRARYSFERVGIDVDQQFLAADIPSSYLADPMDPMSQVDLLTTNPDFSQNFVDEDGDFNRSALELTYVYDSRDSNSTPRKGEKISLGVTLTGGVLGGDVDTYGVSFSGSKHWNLRWDGILTLRGAFEVVDGFGSTDDPPIFERKFLGGSRNLRGFDFRDISPVDERLPRVNDIRNPDGSPLTPAQRAAAVAGGVPDNIQQGSGEPLGGNTSAFITLEYTIPLFEQIRGAIFYDMGFVNADSWDFSASELASDIGLGLRMNLPIGPLAVDYAIPLAKPSSLEDDGGQFNFYLNYEF